ncbi:MAG: ATP-binding protein [Gemmatimonadaceae bacterium]
MPPDHIPHLFDRFWQAKQTARQGAGLGLFIVKGIVEAHGGEVVVKSTVGEGSTFGFTLRLAPQLGMPCPVEVQPSADDLSLS